MPELSESYLTVQYSMRPAKQVERRMLVDGLLLLAEAGFAIRDYQYTGMGSIHFVDFAMFHRFLGIRSMLSVEFSKDIRRRVRFNAPYKNAVAVKAGKAIGDVIPSLSKKRRHMLWLDYDTVLSDYMLRDLSYAASVLPAGSLLLVTVDTEPPGLVGRSQKNTKYNHEPGVTRQHFESVARDYVFPNNGDEDFEYKKLPGMNIRAIRGAIEAGSCGRSDGQFQLLFNFLYADGHRMLTQGGMIASSPDINRIKSSRFAEAVYARFDCDEEPCRISVPCLTRKEQMYLDENMPIASGWSPKAFELSQQEVREYAKIYRFYPTYAELLM